MIKQFISIFSGILLGVILTFSNVYGQQLENKGYECYQYKNYRDRSMAEISYCLNLILNYALNTDPYAQRDLIQYLLQYVSWLEREVRKGDLSEEDAKVKFANIYMQTVAEEERRRHIQGQQQSDDFLETLMMMKLSKPQKHYHYNNK